jgi:cytochrome b
MNFEHGLDAATTGDPAADGRDTRLVWDLPLRATHWLLVLAIAGSWATHYAGIEWFAWHRRFGYAALVLVAFRIVWGFVGTRHARFASFVRGPGAVLAYLRGVGAAGAGHNPLGALSVLGLLAVILFQAATGLFANDEIMNSGPLYGWIDPASSNRITTWHRYSSDVLLVLISLHVLAVAWYALVRRRPVVRAMLSGRKPAAAVPPGEEIAGSRALPALLIVAALAIALTLVVRAAPEATISLY